MSLKTSKGKKATYSFIYAFVFFVSAKKIEKKEEKSLQCNELNTNVPINHFRKSS